MSDYFESPAPCDICEGCGNFHCKTCGDVLCQTCKENHLKSKATKHHTIVLYKETEGRDATSGRVCASHTGSFEFWCDVCRVLVCRKCITSDHKGHQFSDISDIENDKRAVISTEVTRLRDKELQQWQENLDHVDGIITDYKNTADAIDKELISIADNIHKNIDSILTRNRERLQIMKTVTVGELEKHKNGLDAGTNSIRQKLAIYENALGSADVTSLVQLCNEIPKSDDRIPPVLKNRIEFPSFTIGQCEIGALEELYGELTQTLTVCPVVSETTAKSKAMAYSLSKIKETASCSAGSSGTSMSYEERRSSNGTTVDWTNPEICPGSMFAVASNIPSLENDANSQVNVEVTDESNKSALQPTSSILADCQVILTPQSISSISSGHTSLSSALPVRNFGFNADGSLSDPLFTDVASQATVSNPLFTDPISENGVSSSSGFNNPTDQGTLPSTSTFANSLTQAAAPLSSSVFDDSARLFGTQSQSSVFNNASTISLSMENNNYCDTQPESPNIDSPSKKIRLDIEQNLTAFSERTIDPKQSLAKFSKQPTSELPIALASELPVDPSPKQSTTEPIITNSTVVSNFEIDYWYPSVLCLKSGRVWVQTGNQRLQLMDLHGVVTDTIDTDFYFSDITLNSQDDLILYDWSNNSIKSFSIGKKPVTLFKTSCSPLGLCCLQDGDIVMTSRNYGRIIRYSRTGQIIKQADHAIVKRSYRLAVNNVNQNLYICNRSEPHRKVIALDVDFAVRYQYNGLDDQTFDPTEICADKLGRVLITDQRNRTVHVLDQDGGFLHYLRNDVFQMPTTIGVDSEGNVWVGEQLSMSKGRVIVVRYS